MDISTIFLVASAAGIIVAVYLAYRTDKKIQVQEARNELLLNTFRWKWNETSKHFEAQLSEFETLRIKELRLRKAGWDFCVKCGKVSGLHYLHKNGHVAAATLKSFKVWKDNKPVRISKCTECIARGA